MRNRIRFALPVSAVVLAVALLASTNSLSYAQNAVPAAAATAAQLQPIALPAPETTGGMPLMQALNNRKTARTFSDKALSMQQLSNLLWASFGVNRETMAPQGPPHPAATSAAPGPGGPNGPGGAAAPAPQSAPRPNAPPRVQHTQGRTAPSGGNSQDIDLYVATANGAYLYDAVKNQLKPVASSDVRAQITSAAAAKAAVTIIFVAAAQGDQFAQVDTGFIGQNAYLFAASEGLNAWFYTIHGAPALSAVSTALGLDADHAPLYEQTVGYPAQ